MLLIGRHVELAAVRRVLDEIILGKGGRKPCTDSCANTS